MSQPIEFFSHKQGPNPWKTVLIFEELDIPYKTTYLDFGSSKGGVEHEEFLQKNPAGRVPLIIDPKTGLALTESNAIDQYLADRYDKKKMFAVKNELDEYRVNQWLGFQSSTQAPFGAQAIQLRNKNNIEGAAHFHGLVKRTLRTLDEELKDKNYLVANKVTLADLAFVPWDLILDVVLQGDKEAGTADQRKKLFPNWYNWHSRMLERPAVQRMIATQRTVNAAAN
ncbi:hypothetical protein N7510_007760 [Penicillium lagena]|uniref:uncharacterized protein n=1 Tax=Penicillium lagena TaxID=94218 RepID=UPI002540A323|nr:uncharacterized protein N7510_007760 [Penicillium lagena]KAJ5611041.1 hypothetical protein N7510_007760 [Penicillium lagena]